MKQGQISKRRVAESVGQGMLTGLLLAVVFLAGFFIRGQVPATAQSQRDSEFPLLAEVEQLVKDHYLREMPDARELEYAAIRDTWAGSNRLHLLNDPAGCTERVRRPAGQYGGHRVQIRRDEQATSCCIPSRKPVGGPRRAQVTFWSPSTTSRCSPTSA